MKAILCSLFFLFSGVSGVSGHAYFSFPVPRLPFCSINNSSLCAGQGPVFLVPADQPLNSTGPQFFSCNASDWSKVVNPGYDPGFSGTVSATWVAGTQVNVTIFVSEPHSPEDQFVHALDGWQINYRDGTSDQPFQPLDITVYNPHPVTGLGPFPSISWVFGQNITATITVPNAPTSDGVLQFFWRNNEVTPAPDKSLAVSFMSCADVQILPNPNLLLSTKCKNGAASSGAAARFKISAVAAGAAVFAAALSLLL